MRGVLLRHLRGVSIVALAAGGLAPALATAQEAPAAGDSANSMQEIIVTAQKRAQSINDVPMSIQAASGDKLSDLGIKDTADLTKLVSGFTYNRSIYGTNVFTIRGVGFQDSTLAAGPTVTVYVDQVPLPFSAMTPGVGLDVGRVEALKGPQGTLFGQNATGGAINYVPNQPTDNFEAGFDASYGRFNEIDVQGFINLPVSDSLRVRLAARGVHADGWQKEYAHSDRAGAYYPASHPQNKMGERKFINGRMLVDFTPTDRLTLKLNVTGWRDRSEQAAAQFVGVEARGTGAVPPAGYLNFPVAPNNARAASWDPSWNYHQNNRMLFTSLRADYDLGSDMALTSLTSYQHYKRYQPLDNDGTSYNNTYLLNTGDVKTFYQELRLAGKFGGRGSWVVGGNYETDKVYDQFYQTYADSTARYVFGLPLIENLDFSRQKVETYGVFGNIEYPVLDNVTLQGGVRYTKSKRDYEGCGADSGDGLAATVFDAITAYFRGLSGRDPLPPIQPGACISMQSAPEFIPGLDVNKLNEDNVSWRLGVNWDVAPRTLLYANVSRGYKAGSFPTLSVSLNRPQLLPVTQESITAYEVGIKTRIDTLEFSLAGFYYDYKDKQILGGTADPVFGALEALVNVPK
ncbi:MAG: TonB-dependent receptor, partial [Novosphingobium sp.]